MAQLLISGGKIGKSESNAPIPHAITKQVKRSGNYGLANNARTAFPLLIAPPKTTTLIAEKPVTNISGNLNLLGISDHPVALEDTENDGPKPIDPLTEKEKIESEIKKLDLLLRNPFVTVRKNLMALEQPASSVGFEDYHDEPGHTAFAKLYKDFKETTDGSNNNDEEDANVHPPEINSPSLANPMAADSVNDDEDADRRQPATISTSLENPIRARSEVLGQNRGLAAAPAAGGKGLKANGYVMFLNFKKKQNPTHEKSSINDLIKVFDNDWKSLSEEERARWRDRAKEINNNKSSSSKPDTSRGRGGSGFSSVQGSRSTRVQRRTSSEIIDDSESVDDVFDVDDWS